MLLPKVNATQQIASKINTFGGIDYREQIADGALSGGRDVTNDAYPALSVDSQHIASTTFPSGDCKGIISANGHLWAVIYANNAGALYKDGTAFSSATFSDTDKQMVIMGGYLVVFPDGVRINMQDYTDVTYLNVGSTDSLYTFMSPKEAVYLYDPDETVQHPCEFINESTPSGMLAGDYWLKPSYANKKIHYDLYKYVKSADESFSWETVEDTAIGIKHGGANLFKAEDTVTLKCTIGTVDPIVVEDADGLNLNGEFYVLDANDDVIIINGEYPNDRDLVITGSYALKAVMGTVSADITETPIDFTCDIQGVRYTKMTIFQNITNPTITYYDANDNDTTAYTGGEWQRQDVRNLSFQSSVVSKTFYDYILNNSTWSRATPNLNITRAIPAMDYVVERENRLWGCKYGVVNGENVNMIYASKLGDPTNWYSGQGIASDSWNAQIGVGGAFTGAITYGSYVLFFKENCIIRVYGQIPTSFGTQVFYCDGVKYGSSKSLAIIDGYLYYHSPSGFMRYDNTYPTTVSAALGTARFNAAVATSYKKKYVCIASLGTSNTTLSYSMWIYDTRYKTWQQHAVGMACNGMTAHRLDTDDGEGEIYFSANSTGGTHAVYHYGNTSNGYCSNWLATSGDLLMQLDEHKYCKRIVVSCDVPLSSTVYIDIQYDGKGEWYRVATLQTPHERFNSIAIMPRRCGYMKLKFYGTGKAIIYSITKYFDKGSTRCKLT